MYFSGLCHCLWTLVSSSLRLPGQTVQPSNTDSLASSQTLQWDPDLWPSTGSFGSPAHRQPFACFFPWFYRRPSYACLENPLCKYIHTYSFKNTKSEWTLTDTGASEDKQKTGKTSSINPVTSRHGLLHVDPDVSKCHADAVHAVCSPWKPIIHVLLEAGGPMSPPKLSANCSGTAQARHSHYIFISSWVRPGSVAPKMPPNAFLGL